MNKSKPELWAERIEAFLANDLSRRARYKEHDLPQNQLNYWLSKIKEEVDSLMTNIRFRSALI